MQRQFNRLRERVSTLSNHHQKFIRIIDKYGEGLIERLEERGHIEDVHLWKNALDLPKEMDIVLGVAEDFKEKCIFLGCYHAFQILHLNLRSIDVLMLNLTTTDDRIATYKNFMLDVGQQFHFLTATYMKKLLELLFESKTHPEFVIASVGSLAHQDDIDIGIVDDGSQERTEFNKTIGKLRQEMFKWATEMHLYLSEHVGEQTYSASIEEYKQLLDKEIGDFVIISEMLMAVPILGSKRLFNKFERKVTRRYYYRHNRDNKFHEGYLRGILGEVRSLLIRQINEEKLNPKDDGLRMLLGMVLSARTIFRIYRGNRWDVLSILCDHDPDRKNIYQSIEEAVTFLEVFRHLYQLFVAQEEEIHLSDPSIPEQLEIVAKTLGYQDVGAIKAWDHLLIHYHENVELAKDAASQLLDEVTEHLRSVSRFTGMIKASWHADQYRSYAGNLAIDFLKKSAFFKGTKFWDDLLEALDVKDSHVLENLIKDLKSLNPRYLSLVIDKYGKASQNAFYPMISFLVKLSENKRKLACEDLFIKFNNSYLNHAAKNPECAIKLTKVFRQFPKLINDYLKILDGNEQQKFLALLDIELWSKEDAASKEQLMHLCKLHFDNSHYFKRFLLRVINKYPEYIQSLQNTTALQQIAKGFLGNIDSLPTFEEKKKQLGSYYDLEFLRVGLETIHGAPIEKINTEFTEFSDNYIQALFDICKQSVVDEIGENIPTRDLFAVYTTGGHAREQAFDDDYDLILFLNDNKPEINNFVTKIASRMNSEIIKRGTMPHYRFADHFGSYVTLVEQLDDHLSSQHDEIFIDKSQILGARMIVGSTKFEEFFQQHILKQHIFDQNETYIQQMIDEMKSRHQDVKRIKPENTNVKEAIGGLRDIEMILLIFKAKYKLREPINQKLVDKLCQLQPNEKFCILGMAFNFLKNLRDIYRLTVSTEDDLNMEYVARIAHVMGYDDSATQTAKDKLISEYHQCTEKVTQIIEDLLTEFII